MEYGLLKKCPPEIPLLKMYQGADFLLESVELVRLAAITWAMEMRAASRGMASAFEVAVVMGVASVMETRAVVEKGA
jgi:hypothetical protein